MKKTILVLGTALVFISCKDETKEKVKEATKAVTADVKQAADSVKVKAKKVIDSSHVKDKAKEIIAKGAEKVEKGAQKVQEAVTK